jgi:WD40 repeat protein
MGETPLASAYTLPWLIRFVCIFLVLTATALAQKTSEPASKSAVLVPQLGHSTYVRFMRLAHGGRLVTIGLDQTLKVWDLESGLLIRTVEGFGQARALAVSPDGRLAITTKSSDGWIEVWDLERGEIARRINSGDPNVGDRQIALSPDGRMMFVGGSLFDSSQLWDLRNGRVLLQPAVARGVGGIVTRAAFTPDGKQLIAATSAGAMAVLELPSGRILHNLRDPVAKSVDDYFDALALSPDGRFLLEGFQDLKGEKGVLIGIWDVASGKLLRSVRSDSSTKNIREYVVLPGGKRALGMTDSSMEPVRLLDLETGKILETFEGTIRAVVTPDGKRMLTAQRFVPGGRRPGFKLWDLQRREVLLDFGNRGGLAASALPIDNDRIILNGATAQIWDIGSARPIRTLGEGGVIGLTADHGSAIVGYYDPATDRPGFLVRNLSGVAPPIHVSTPSANSPRLYTMRTDGRRIATYESDGHIAFRDLAADAAVRRVRLQYGAGVDIRNPLLISDISSDLKRAVGRERLTEGASKVLRVWDIESGRILLSLIDPNAQKVESKGQDYFPIPVSASFSAYLTHFAKFAPDVSRVVADGVDDEFRGSNSRAGRLGKTKIWDARTGALINTSAGIFNHHASAFTADGRLAYFGGMDAIVWAVDVDSSTTIKRSSHQGGDITSLTLTPDGRRLIASVAGSFFRVLDAASLETLITLVGSDAGEWLAITPEGFFSGFERAAHLLTVVRGFNVYSIQQMYQSLFNPDLVREASAGDPSHEVREAAKVINLEKVLDSGPAPDVAIISPSGGSQSSADLVTINARVVDKGTGIGRIEWRVNGITAAVAAKPEGAGPEYVLSQQLALDAGDNVIEVVAYNSKNLLASLPARTTIKFSGTNDATKPRLHVLAIGINAYVDRGWRPAGQSETYAFLPLALAVDDAKAIGDGLKLAASGLYADVRLTTVTDAEATRENLSKIIDRIAAEVHPRDTFILFAAAHGKSEAGRFYLIPQDYDGGPNPSALAARAVDQGQFQDWLANRIKAKKAVILLDTCESGALVSGHARSRTDAPASEAALGRLHEATGRPVLAAAAEGKPAFEGYEGHGVFTWSLLNALKNGDRNGNGTIELSELVAHVQEQVPKLAAKLDGRGLAAIAVRGSVGDVQSARFGSRGEDFVLTRRLQ